MKLLLVPVVVVLLLAIPGGVFAYAQNTLDQAQSLETQQKYADALAAYQTVLSVAGNPVSRLLLAELANKAQIGAARSHYAWGQQDERAGTYADAQGQYQAAVDSGVADWQSQGNGALAALFLDWGGALARDKQFEQAIDKYRQVANYDPAGLLKDKTSEALATAYAGYALAFTLQTPPDYAQAIKWYQDLVTQFPTSPEAKQAQASWLPQTLYEAGLAYVQQSRYDQARDAMKQVISTYPKTTWAQKASAAMAASQPLTGRLVTGDGTPVPNRLLRISTKWLIVAPHTYDDAGGQHFQTVTDASGNFSLIVPPGQNYLVTWWDPSRQNFVTTFVNDSVPVNQINIDPLQPAHANVAIS